MGKSIENKIRLNAIMIYLIVAVICGGFIFYFYSYGQDIITQKKTIEEYTKELNQTNELIQAINRAQSEANLFISTKQVKHLRSFREQISAIELQIDSLRADRTSLPSDSILGEVNNLLKEKGKAITALNQQFRNQNPLDSLSEKLQVYEPAVRIDTSVVTTIKEDTLTWEAPKRNLWQRLSNVFSPKEKEDTVVTVTKTATNIIKVVEPDSLPVTRAVAQARKDYTLHITAIEKQVSMLILADQDISSKISDLLLLLNTQVVYSRLEQLEEEESKFRFGNKMIIIGGIASLLLILFFILLIIYYVNKGYKTRADLEKANRRTQQLLESRHKLLLSVSHDVKTPLNSILGYLELSDKKNGLSPKEITSMQNSGKHILALLNNLLEYSSLEQGTLQLSPRNFNLQELCIEICEMFDSLARNKNLRFKYKQDFTSDLIIYSDSLKIKQILINLLSNAVKYTREGNIDFRATCLEDILQFTISDTGVGIPQSELENIYKPFTRVDENNSLAEGTGFGMYVVRGLIDLFGGVILYKSEVGKGTEVTVRLPVEKSEELPPVLSTSHIAIIDDDPVFLTLIRQLCEQLGHKVTTVCSREELEFLLHSLPDFDILMTDMEMGTFTGNDVLEKARQHDDRIKIILMTGRMDYNTQKAQNDGFDDYLPKPVTLSDLHSLIGGIPSGSSQMLIHDVLDQNTEAIKEVLEQFTFSSLNHIVLLRESVRENEFEKAQAICHKMLPMFIQIGAEEETIQILRQMDSLRGKQIPEDFDWKERIETVAIQTEKLIQKIVES